MAGQLQALSVAQVSGFSPDSDACSIGVLLSGLPVCDPVCGPLFFTSCDWRWHFPPCAKASGQQTLERLNPHYNGSLVSVWVQLCI